VRAELDPWLAEGADAPASLREPLRAIAEKHGVRL